MYHSSTNTPAKYQRGKKTVYGDIMYNKKKLPAMGFSQDVIQLIIWAPETGSYNRCEG